MTLDELRAALPDDHPWLTEALASIAEDPKAIAHLFPQAARKVGRAPIGPDWTADEAARVLMLDATTQPQDEIESLYRYGDAAEKRAVLKALPFLPVGDHGVPLLHDAIRTNDTRLVAAALGPYAAHLDDGAWRQAVLKCVFMGIPLSTVDALERRKDTELAEMLAGLVAERTAAGRDTAADAVALLHSLKG